MPHITVCTVCWSCYEESSEEAANAPIRECHTCWARRQNERRHEGDLHDTRQTREKTTGTAKISQVLYRTESFVVEKCSR